MADARRTLSILLALADLQDCTASDLAELSEAEDKEVASVLVGLVEEGLIFRVTHPSRRTRYIVTDAQLGALRNRAVTIAQKLARKAL